MVLPEQLMGSALVSMPGIEKEGAESSALCPLLICLSLQSSLLYSVLLFLSAALFKFLYCSLIEIISLRVDYHNHGKVFDSQLSDCLGS